MATLYFLSLTFAAIQCFRSGYHARLPLFFGMVMASILFEFLYLPRDVIWQRKWYPVLMGNLLFWRVLACAEAFWLHCRSPLRGLTAAATGFLAAVFALLVAWQCTSGSELFNAVQWRRIVVVGLAAYLGIYILFLFSVRRWCGAHILLLWSLYSVLSLSWIVRVFFSWDAISQIAYGVSAVIFGGWIWLFSQAHSKERRSGLSVL